MPTINIDGINFDLAQADGELERVRIEDREEFLEIHADDLEADDMEPTDRNICQWARDHLLDSAYRLIDWEMEDDWDRYGVSRGDLLYPRTCWRG